MRTAVSPLPKANVKTCLEQHARLSVYRNLIASSSAVTKLLSTPQMLLFLSLCLFVSFLFFVVLLIFFCVSVVIEEMLDSLLKNYILYKFEMN